MEIPFTREHWEAYWVARHVSHRPRVGAPDRLPLQRRPVPAADPDAYRSWLVANAVDFVALPDVPIDVGRGGRGSAVAPPTALPRAGVARRALAGVAGARPRPARRRRCRAARLRSVLARSVLRACGERGGRIRYDPLWHVSAGRACIAPDVRRLDRRAGRARAGPVGLSASVNGRRARPAAATVDGRFSRTSSLGTSTAMKRAAGHPGGERHGLSGRPAGAARRLRIARRGRRADRHRPHRRAVPVRALGAQAAVRRQPRRSRASRSPTATADQDTSASSSVFARSERAAVLPAARAHTSRTAGRRTGTPPRRTRCPRSAPARPRPVRRTGRARRAARAGRRR